MNCKKGDLAVVIFVKDMRLQTNVGRIVRVLGFATPKKYEGLGTLQRWWIRSEGSPMACSGGMMKMTGKMPDIALRPIRQIPEQETTRHDEEITA